MHVGAGLVLILASRHCTGLSFLRDGRNDRDILLVSRILRRKRTIKIVNHHIDMLTIYQV